MICLICPRRETFLADGPSKPRNYTPTYTTIGFVCRTYAIPSPLTTRFAKNQPREQNDAVRGLFGMLFIVPRASHHRGATVYMAE